MKNPDRETVSRLDELPNIGKAIAGLLRLAGVDHPKKLIGKDPFELFEDICAASGERYDPCVIDVFISVVRFMEGQAPQPWWSFTAERKKHIVQKHSAGARAEK
ncbi:MAG: mitomycin resistance protein [bacterium]|nr:mitomycin resistance protein [bacterium]